MITSKQFLTILRLVILVEFIGSVIQAVDGLAGNKRRYRQQSSRSIDNHRIDGKNSARKKLSDTYNVSDNRNSGNSKETLMLSKAFRMLYDQGGTTSVLNGCRDTLLQYKAPDLVEAALLAGNPLDDTNGFRSKGVSSGILNALLGCCCLKDHNDSASRAEMAIELMRAYDAIAEKRGQNALTPDLVSLCLAYVALLDIPGTDIFYGNGGGNDHPKAAEFLRRAEQFYHTKPAVSKQVAKPKSIATQPNSNWSELMEDYGVQVLQDAKEFVVLSKPSGMVCYHGKNGANRQGKGGSSKNQRSQKTDKSLEECLLAHSLTLSSLNQEGRGLVHRIDRGTSGCLVVAKTNRMHAILLTQFFLRKAKKSYQALVCSSIEQLTTRHDEVISSPIEGRPATSRYSIEASVGHLVTRIRINTEQGRRHQVRIHCSDGLNAPILLDPLYGGQSILSTLLRQTRNGAILTEARGSKKFCLHASTLKIDTVGIDVEAPLEEWWKKLEDGLR